MSTTTNKTTKAKATTKTAKKDTKAEAPKQDGPEIIKNEDGTKVVKISDKVSLPINTASVDENFIPKALPYKDTNGILEQVGILLNFRMPTLFIGETGVGKTSIGRYIASVTQNGFVRVNHNGSTAIEDIVGRYIAVNGQTVWVDGALTKAMKEGMIYFADEINAAPAEINFVYHQVLDDDGRLTLVEKDHEVVKAHPNFRFMAGMNPPTDYAGTKELNRALLSRFAVINVDYPDPKTEEAIIMERTKVNAETAERMVAFAGQLRSSHQKGTMRYAISTRDLIMWGQLYQVYNLFVPSMEMAVLNKIDDEDEIKAVKDIVGLTLAEYDAKKSGTNAKSKSTDTSEENTSEENEAEEGDLPF